MTLDSGRFGRFGLKTGRNALVARPMLGTAIVVAFATAFMILFVDRPITYFVAEDLDPSIAAFFRALTEIGNGTVYMTASASFWLGFRWLAAQNADPAVAERFKRISAYGAFALTALLAAGAVATILKHALGRFRPSLLLTDGVYGLAPLTFLPKSTSLPSGHTQVMWTVATILVLLKPRIGLLLIPIAVLVGASRVAINVHFLSDVLLGAYVGVLVPLLVYVAFFPRLGPAPERLGQIRRILGLSP
ncbi:MAG: phosphatase PAP2 family protein [Rhodospirillaceae bacterium]|nr:phosphatase PAP2 family protein [Rhodospirillaceae bacterium]